MKLSFCNPEKVFDLHANPTLLGLFMRGNSYDSIYRFERHMVLPKILAQESVQQSCLSSPFAFQCCNMLQLLNTLKNELHNLNLHLNLNLRCSKWVSNGE